MDLGGASVSGPRPYNEDTFLVKDLSAWSAQLGGLEAFIMISDGMGGHQSGDVASRVAIETAEGYVDDLVAMAAQSALNVDAEQALREIALEANDAVISEGQRRGTTSMGATLVAAFIGSKTAYVGHVGDSRAYLIHGGEARQLTVDHSAVGRMIAEGILTEEQAQSHPNRNVIERALGFAGAEAETKSVPLEVGDALMLCSDGLSTVLTGADIVRVCAGSSGAQNAADSLTAEAITARTDDNTTAVIWADDWSLLRMSVPQHNDTRRARSKQRRQHARHSNASRTSFWIMGFVALLAAGIVVAALMTGPKATSGGVTSKVTTQTPPATTSPQPSAATTAPPLEAPPGGEVLGTADQGAPGVITAGNNLRTEPGTDSAKWARVTKKVNVYTVGEPENGWFKIRTEELKEQVGSLKGAPSNQDTWPEFVWAKFFKSSVQ